MFYDLIIYYVLFFALFLMPVICMSTFVILPQGNVQILRITSLLFSLFTLFSLIVCWLYCLFYNITFEFRYGQSTFFFFTINSLNILFLILSSFLTIIAVLISWQWLPKFFSIRIYLFLIFSIQYISFYFFSTENILMFYIFFEAVLIPMYILIGIWGLRHRKIHAAYQFFLYTFAGSIFMLMSILYMRNLFGTFLINELRYFSNFLTLFEYKIIWLSFFLGFAVKTPMIPFHIWLPEAHVEAPTAGSVILAGLLLKYGTYGFYKILVICLYNGLNFFSNLIITLSLISIVYGSIITYTQIDFKKIIAYSSVSHMGYVILGLCIKSPESLTGSLLMMLTHGFISSGLFFIVGILYERYGTRNIFDYGGIKTVMPLYVFYFFLLTLSNMHLPLTGGFIAEFLVLSGLIYVKTKLILIIAGIGIFTNGVYAIWLFNRICFGNFSFNNNNSMYFSDIDKREHFILFLFMFFICFIGVCPFLFINSFELIIIKQLLLIYA